MQIAPSLLVDWKTFCFFKISEYNGFTLILNIWLCETVYPLKALEID